MSTLLYFSHQPPKRVLIVAYLLIIISIVSAVQSLPQTTKLRSHINWNLECMINRNQRQVWTGEILSPLRVRAKTKQSINKTGTAEAEGRGSKEPDTVRTKNKCPNMHNCILHTVCSGRTQWENVPVLVNHAPLNGSQDKCSMLAKNRIQTETKNISYVLHRAQVLILNVSVVLGLSTTCILQLFTILQSLYC